MDAGPAVDGLFVQGEPVTPGFHALRERARCLNLQLVLDDGTVGLGDCLSVIRSGTRDRAAPFYPEAYESFVAGPLSARLTGVEVDGFRSLAAIIDDLDLNGSPLHPGLGYGLSQAMLDAAASAQRRT